MSEYASVMYRWIPRSSGFLRTGKGSTQWKIYWYSWRRKWLRRITVSLFNLQKALPSGSLWDLLLVCWKNLCPLLTLNYVSGVIHCRSHAFYDKKKKVYVDGGDVVRLIMKFLLVCKLSKTASSPVHLFNLFNLIISCI